MAPLWGTIWVSYFLYLPPSSFFGFQILEWNRPFFSPAIFYIDGWMGWMGWMGWDGMVGQLFFFCPYLENYLILFHNCFRSFLIMFFHIFWNILRKKSECSLFQKMSPKSTPPFFAKMFTRIFQISRKLLDIFFSLFLVPQVEV